MAQTSGSTLNRLLMELSWAGPGIRAYRDGGSGFENVLTAEVLTALDFLPRTEFLGAVLRAAQGADGARKNLIDEVEQLNVIVLPDELSLSGSVGVQPDACLTSPGCYVLIEAKRIRRSSFQPEQLAREFVAVVQEARGRSPLLLLLLGEVPPVPVDRHGRLEIEQAIALHLDAVLDRVGASDLDRDALLERVPDTCAWITWHELAKTVADSEATFSSDNRSVAGTVKRLADSVAHAIERHS